jgi:hypothetical protein
MEELKSYLDLARSTSVAEFVAQIDSVFLVKRPNQRGALSPAPAAISYDTQHNRQQVDPYATEWRIVPVKKRHGNPYPDRISIGRATNCDVVIRVPSVSKVQAHILVGGPNSYDLRDNEASSPTSVNGRTLEARAKVALQVGDRISFGGLELEFADAKRLHQILRSEVITSRSASM